MIGCGGSSGPSYCQQIETETDTEGTHVKLESHNVVASLKSDLQISLAWGFPCVRDFKEKWANSFADPKASSHFVDFLFNRVLVFRNLYVTVDGQRCILPLPNHKTQKAGGDAPILEIADDQYSFFRLLNSLDANSLEANSDFESYIRRANIEVKKNLGFERDIL